jgi:beta-glucosidase
LALARDLHGNTPTGKCNTSSIWTAIANSWRFPPEAVAAARNADIVIAVVGITSRLEGEEMLVTVPGFQGGDRTSIDLPEPEESLVAAVAATGKPLVVVLMNGSALAVNWINDHANAILEAWYPGEEGGAAVAETLSGKNNPAGRLLLRSTKMSANCRTLRITRCREGPIGTSRESRSTRLAMD